jgi:integrase
MSTKTRIGLREIAKIQPGTTIWDSEVACFGARRQKSESISYIVYYRTAENRQRFHTIGRHGSPWTPETARKEAKRILGAVASGQDPAEAKRIKRHAESLSDLCDRYFEDAKAGRILSRRKQPKKLSTLLTDQSRATRASGRCSESALSFQLHAPTLNASCIRLPKARPPHDRPLQKREEFSIIRRGKGAASRTVGLLGAIFAYAVRNGIRTDNPVRGVERFADGRRVRRVSDDEYQIIGRTYLAATSKGVWPPLISAMQFLTVTGWRTGEVVGLNWSEVDLPRRTAFLGDTKTGRSVRPLSRAACDILRRQQTKEGLIFPAARGLGPMTGFPKVWRRLMGRHGLSNDVTPHVLRHSFASLAHDLGYSDLTIAALLGHRGASVTSRYIHGSDTILLAAADAISSKTLQLMGIAPRVEVVELRAVG